MGEFNLTFVHRKKTWEDEGRAKYVPHRGRAWLASVEPRAEPGSKNRENESAKQEQLMLRAENEHGGGDGTVWLNREWMNDAFAFAM